MDDLISRQAAIRWVKTECNPYGKPTLDYESCKKVIEHLGQMPSIKTESSWIPVTEKLPEHKKTHYWICTDTGYQCECLWTDNRFGIGNLSGEWGWSIFYTPQYSKVVAWMPLPEPYKMN